MLRPARRALWQAARVGAPRRTLSYFGGETDDAPTAIYTNFHIYKGSAALGMSVVPPQFKRTDKPDQSHFLSVERPGTVLLDFVPSASQSSGDQKYDWQQKQFFALSAFECGDFVAKTSVRQKVSYVHDPTLLGGQTNSPRSPQAEHAASKVKRMVVDPMKDGDGFFFNYSNEMTKINIPVSAGEYIVFRQLLLTAIPHITGFNTSFESPPRINSGQQQYGGNYGRSNNSYQQQGGSYNAGGGGGGGEGVVFNPFEGQDQTGNRKDTRSSSNWLDEL